eukprot:TRINITY_DN10849_c0_g1_i5.p1 TRINITY_DN10849_c0_g1~~TRINITY_DN10849_c0_g1_i5.p1  ORF type:complete len:141 (-),score=37.20 TRINITY_DN10849_c0_g1_i5:174-596(-)
MKDVAQVLVVVDHSQVNGSLSIGVFTIHFSSLFQKEGCNVDGLVLGCQMQGGVASSIRVAPRSPMRNQHLSHGLQTPLKGKLQGRLLRVVDRVGVAVELEQELNAAKRRLILHQSVQQGSIAFVISNNEKIRHLSDEAID